MRHLLAAATWVSHPPLRFIIGLWAISTAVLAVAFWQRTTIEQWNAVGFAFASVALLASWRTRNMVLAFAGFGLAASACFVRVVSALAVAQSSSGAQIITVAWSLIFFKAIQRMSSSYMAAMTRPR